MKVAHATKTAIVPDLEVPNLKSLQRDYPGQNIVSIASSPSLTGSVSFDLLKIGTARDTDNERNNPVAYRRRLDQKIKASGFRFVLDIRHAEWIVQNQRDLNREIWNRLFGLLSRGRVSSFDCPGLVVKDKKEDQLIAYVQRASSGEFALRWGKLGCLTPDMYVAVGNRASSSARRRAKKMRVRPNRVIRIK